MFAGFRASEKGNGNRIKEKTMRFGIGQPEIDAVADCIRKGELARFQVGANGRIARCEKELAAMSGTKYALLVNSGTSALICGMVALGIGPGDDVLVSSYTWISSPLAPMLVGAIPRLVEMDDTLTMDPDDLEAKIRPDTKAIICVHMMNMPCDMDRIMAIANRHGIPVLEDACQAVGGLYKGKRLGSFGKIAAYSFNNYKNISCGEGGAVITDDEELYDRARLYHDAGTFVQNYEHAVQIPFFAGQDYRASEIQAAILLEQLKRLDPGMERWRDRVRLMRGLIEKRGGFHIARHNDPDSACALLLQFDTEAEADAFSQKHHCLRLINSGRHVFTNWAPLTERRAYRDDVNPLITPKGLLAKYDESAAPRTLDLMRRTCDVTPRWDMTDEQVAARVDAFYA